MNSFTSTSTSSSGLSSPLNPWEEYDIAIQKVNYLARELDHIICQPLRLSPGAFIGKDLKLVNHFINAGHFHVFKCNLEEGFAAGKINPRLKPVVAELLDLLGEAAVGDWSLTEDHISPTHIKLARWLLVSFAGGRLAERLAENIRQRSKLARELVEGLIEPLDDVPAGQPIINGGSLESSLHYFRLMLQEHLYYDLIGGPALENEFKDDHGKRQLNLYPFLTTYESGHDFSAPNLLKEVQDTLENLSPWLDEDPTRRVIAISQTKIAASNTGSTQSTRSFEVRVDHKLTRVASDIYNYSRSLGVVRDECNKEYHEEPSQESLIAAPSIAQSPTVSGRRSADAGQDDNFRYPLKFRGGMQGFMGTSGGPRGPSRDFVEQFGRQQAYSFPAVTSNRPATSQGSHTPDQHSRYDRQTFELPARVRSAGSQVNAACDEPINPQQASQRLPDDVKTAVQALDSIAANPHSRDAFATVSTIAQSLVKAVDALKESDANRIAREEQVATNHHPAHASAESISRTASGYGSGTPEGTVSPLHETPGKVEKLLTGNVERLSPDEVGRQMTKGNNYFGALVE